MKGKKGAFGLAEAQLEDPRACMRMAEVLCLLESLPAADPGSGGCSRFHHDDWGRLGGAVGYASDFSSGHDLAVREFEPRVRLWADGSEPGTCFRFCVSLSLCPSPVRALSLSVPKINKKR